MEREADRLVFREVARENWRDFEALFECRGGPKSCWCMYWRATPAEWKQADGPSRKAAMHARVAAGSTLGLLRVSGRQPGGVLWDFGKSVALEAAGTFSS